MTLPQRRLGRTGLSVSPIGFGGAVIGIDGYLTPEDRDTETFRTRARAALEAAVACGVTMFDTAPGYGAGRSERLYGEVLESVREWIVLATKVGVRPADDEAVWWESLRASLQRLRTDHVDLVQLHGSTWTDDQVEWVLSGPLRWMESARSAGLTRFVGITAEAPSGALERLIRSERFDVLQIAYSVIYEDPCDYQREPFGVIPLAKSFDMGVLTMRTTTSGVLQRLLTMEFPSLDPAAISRLAIKFVLSTPEVDCALVGMSDPAEVEANCALAADQADRLDLRALHQRIS